MSSIASNIRHVMLPLAALLLVGCDKSEKPYEERPVTDLYNSAYKKYSAGDFDDAAQAFEEVERQHPYSSWASKADLMAAHAYYLAKKYHLAVGALESFIQLHPAHEDVGYAYYLRALCYYHDILSVVRDQKNTVQALDALRDVVKRFPGTTYARDAKLKIDFVLDHLAGGEMEVGRYYLKKKHYLAAINRFRYVIETYQHTTHVPEALHRLVECYVASGLKHEAQQTAAILGHNFPGSEWYADAFYLLKGEDLRPEWVKAQEGSWLKKIFN